MGALSVDKRARAQGRRGKSGRFAMLPHAVLESPACASLSNGHFRVLMALVADYNGNNNGALALTRSQAHKRGIGGNDTLSRGLNALELHGLVIRTDPGMRTPPSPARFAITWKPTDKTKYSDRAAPSHEYKNFVPPEKRKTKRIRKFNSDARTSCIQMPEHHASKAVNL